MRKVKTRQILAHAVIIARSATFLEKHAQNIAQRANDDSFAGLRSSMGGGGHGGGHGDPVGRAVSQPLDDPAGRAAKEMLEALGEAERLMSRAARAGLSLLALDESAAAKLAKDSEIVATAVCANPACVIVVENTRLDRLREGRCHGCYRFRKMHEGDERPRERCEQDARRRGQLRDDEAE